MDLEREVSQLIARVGALEAALAESQARQAPIEAQPLPEPVIPATPGPTFLPATTAPAAAPVAAPVVAATVPPPPTPADAVAQPAFPPPPPPGQPLAEQPKGPAFEWGIESLLRWAGVALVTLAGIFLVSAAVTRGWIGPELQLLGAALAGAALLGGAIRLAPTRRPWALAVGSGGSIVLAASAIAAHEWLDLVPAGVAVALLAFTTAASIFVAHHLRIEGIAVTAAVVGMWAPLETLSNFGDSAILAWVVAGILASTALGLTKTWPGMRILVGWLGAGICLLYTQVEDVEGAVQTLGFIGAIVVAVVLLVGPVIAHRMAPDTGPGMWGSFDWKAIDFRLVGVVPGWLWLVFIGLISTDERRTIGFVALTIVLAFAALIAATWQQVPRIISISLIMGTMSLLALAIVFLLSGPLLMVGLAAQAASSYYLARLLKDSLLRYTALAVGLIASAIAGFEMLVAIGDDGFDNIGYGLATLAIVAGWIAVTVRAYRHGDFDVSFEGPLVTAWIATMVWLAAALLAAPQGLLLISVAWTVMACAGLAAGLVNRIAVLKNAAMVTLGITLLKLVSVDMAEVDVLWRVGLFFLVGMGLIALGLKVPSLLGLSGEDTSEVAPGHPVGQPGGPPSPDFTTF